MSHSIISQTVNSGKKIGHRSADGVRCYKHTSSYVKRRASEIVQEDITCKVRKQEYEENKEGEMSETKEE